MAVQSNDTDLKDLLLQVQKGELQLPEFQRSWVWDDGKICKLIESITMGFPMGVVMFLETGGEVNYKPRVFTGVDPQMVNVKPDYLVLDGQQRLTTLFQVFMSKKPVETCWERNKSSVIYRYYYLDIVKALDDNEDREDAIISISDKKVKTSDIGKVITLDLSTRELEYENLMFPLNLMFDPTESMNWCLGMLQYYQNDPTKLALYQKFNTDIISSVIAYKLPAIKVLKNTSQSSVCQIFENVNRGGVPLNVFELVTASLAAEGIELRQEWNAIKKDFSQFNVMRDIDGTSFITSMTLWDSYEKSIASGGKTGVKCKKKDVMGLRASVFKAKRDTLKKGFVEAARFLIKQGVYAADNLPYNTQFVPLAAIFAYDMSHQHLLTNMPNLSKLSKWYWCGVFGELYGSANETRYASDIKDLFAWLFDDNAIPDTVSRSSFHATRLLSLQTRNSAAYKGVMALLLQDEPLDFMTGGKMTVATYTSENTDIHHIFPANYCEKINLPREKWNSVINKTMIYASTNRSIGGVAPSRYIQTILNHKIALKDLASAVSTHKIDFNLLNSDNFNEFIVNRAMKLADRIEKATGKAVSGRDSEDTVKKFGASLANS